MPVVKSLTKAEAKFLRDLGVAKDDFLWLDEQISIHQATGGLTRIHPNVVVYKAAAIEFRKAPLQYDVNITEVAPDKALVNYIDWNV